MEKFQAMKRRNEKKMQLLPALLQLCVRVVMLGLFLSSPHWLPALCSSARFFFMETLPGVCALLSRPKCLFIISNVIIIFLVGESKLSRSTTSSPQQPDIYEAYVAHRQSLHKAAVAGGEDQVVCQAQVAEVTAVDEAPPVQETKEVEDEVVQEEEEFDREREEELEEKAAAAAAAKEEEEEQEQEEEEEEEFDREREEELEEKAAAEEEEEEEEDQEEEELGLPVEELNRRVEDLIAKVNMQRKLEARMLLLCY